MWRNLKKTKGFRIINFISFQIFVNLRTLANVTFSRNLTKEVNWIFVIYFPFWYLMNCICSPNDSKNTLKAFDDFRLKQQKFMKKCFLTCKCMYILKVYSIRYTLKQNTKIPFDQNKSYKKCPLFFASSKSSQFYF